MEKYVSLELEVIEISEDIICTSNELPKTPLSKKPYEIYEQNESDDDD